MSPPEGCSCHAPPALFDDLVVQEILLRFPPGEPASLARASLVCKAWRRVVLDDPGFRRRFSELHGAPPMLGFLYNDFSDGFSCDSGFAPTTAFFPPHPVRRNRYVLDARHGLALFETFMPEDDEPQSLIVWDLFTDGQWWVPYPDTRSESWDAAVLCSADGCDHLDCHGRPFLIVFVGTDENGLTSACVYTSEAAAWRDITSTAHHPYAWVNKRPGVLLGNIIHFPCAMGARIIEYDIAEQKLSWIDAPFEYLDNERNFILMTAEDGVLGFAGMEDSCMYMWARVIDANGAMAWAQPRVIELDKLFPTGMLSTTPSVVGFVEGVGVIFLNTYPGLIMVDLNSGRVRKVTSGGCVSVAIPYMSFYTPRTGLERAHELFQKGAR